ncbi:3-hydroxybutyrate oligomer hydrolase family protein [Paraburkholderia dipogonis]|uniref:3-hydroxybutyrate oligomer hydrolase family protein n=1 Tax=Paraburkholderia dipogonis TaxID=1211383 RepID=UPI0035EF0051
MFDAFLGVAGFDTRFVPLHYYNIQALNLMWSASEERYAAAAVAVIHHGCRAAARRAPRRALTTANLPAIAASPGINAITVTNGAVNVPN